MNTQYFDHSAHTVSHSMKLALDTNLSGPGEQEDTEPRPEDNDNEVRAERALDARARRVAKAAGFIARKSHARIYSHENQQGFQILDGCSGFPIAGWTYDYSAQDVIDFINELPE